MVQRSSRKTAHRLLRAGRRLSQALFLLLFLFLFVKTDYTGSDTIAYAVNILFRIDPLLALATMLAVKAVVALMLPALVLAGLTLVCGRGFCGWLCPLGSILDGWRAVTRTGRGAAATRFPDLARILLVVILVSALFGLPLAGYLDPFSILVRGLSQALYPGLNEITVSFFTFTYQEAPAWVNLVSEPLYAFLQRSLLPFAQKYYQFGLISLLVLVLVVAGEHLQSRFFCRSLCPLGALLGWGASLGTLRLKGGDDDCGACRRCAEVCRTGAVDGERRIEMRDCILCLDCLESCPRQIITFAGSPPLSRGLGVSLSRRRFLAAASVSVIAPAVLATRTLAISPDPLLIRPPGARPETEFLRLCVRCGQCMQVCISNGLQPALFRAGFEGLFSPVLVARTGYCEFNCTLCGQVCPTGALEALSLEDKHRFKIGHAWFDRNLCLPYAKHIPCIVCEEHCPTPDKAIRFESVAVTGEDGQQRTIKQPYVVDELCIGCGICETRCPLPGRPGINLTSDGEARHPERRLPRPPSAAGPYG